MKLSIITINLNNASGLKDTIESVMAQTFTDFEYLIIDGGSTDESIKVIQENETNIDFWVSEKDGGIYNAMNKAIGVALGDYIYFLNSGDAFATDSVLDNIFKEEPKTDFIFGAVLCNYRSGIKRHLPPKVITFYHLLRKGIIHQGTFTKRNLFEKFGFYDEEFKIVSDWKFLIFAICIYNSSYITLDIDLCIYDTSGISSSSVSRNLIIEEKEKILYAHFGAFMLDYNEYTKLRRFTKNGIKDIFIYYVEMIINKASLWL